MKIYFAGSIRGGRDDRDLYLQIIGLLGKHGQVLTEHVGDGALSAMGETQHTEEYIYERDMAWLEQAEAVVAEVTTPSLGVGYELAKAEGQKPVLCLFRPESGRRISGMISGNKNLQLQNYATLSDVEKILAEFFQNLR